MVLHARSADRARTIGEFASRAAGIVIGDLSSAREVRGIAAQVNSIGRMDAVIHNAGVYTARSRGLTGEGHAGTLAVNTLAPYRAGKSAGEENLNETVKPLKEVPPV